MNAIGLRAKQLYPQKRVLYVSARLFQTQYTDAVLHNASNDFINFYQSIDILIVDDVQDWAGKAKTLNTFFHISTTSSAMVSESFWQATDLLWS